MAADTLTHAEEILLTSLVGEAPAGSPPRRTAQEIHPLLARGSYRSPTAARIFPQARATATMESPSSRATQALADDILARLDAEATRLWGSGQWGQAGAAIGSPFASAAPPAPSPGKARDQLRGSRSLGGLAFSDRRDDSGSDEYAYDSDGYGDGDEDDGASPEYQEVLHGSIGRHSAVASPTRPKTPVTRHGGRFGGGFSLEDDIEDLRNEITLISGKWSRVATGVVLQWAAV